MTFFRTCAIAGLIVEGIVGAYGLRTVWAEHEKLKLSSAPALITPCLVLPLVHVNEPDAIDVTGLKPATAKALVRLEKFVISAGGTLVLTSAYRPPHYQQHLRNVWEKWMNELRDNQEPSCQALRAQVGHEFIRHQLLETQRPASDSDHTRGVGFDASVFLPKGARLNRRRIGLDQLARLCHLRRPAPVRDRVHFRLWPIPKNG